VPDNNSEPVLCVVPFFIVNELQASGIALTSFSGFSSCVPRTLADLSNYLAFIDPLAMQDLGELISQVSQRVIDIGERCALAQTARR